jgi:phosphoglycerol transferase MdoB-like AlkP superfamily enzyme
MARPTPSRYSNGVYLIAAYGLSIVCFTAFRVLLLSLHQKDILHFGMERHWLVAQAFLMGFRFDTLITCYLLAPPMIVLGFLSLTGLLKKWMLMAAYIYTGIAFTGAFLFCAMDIPFYEHFFKRLDDTLIAWKEHSSFGINMILQEQHYYPFLLLFAVAATLYCLLLRSLYRSHVQSLSIARQKASSRPAWHYSPVMLLFCALFFLGMRGRTAAKTPLLAGAAYICDDPTINALGLNPVFTLMRTTMDAQQPENQRLHWISDEVALRATADMLHADPKLAAISPIARKVTPDAPLQRRNVVLIIMESMSSAKMQRFGNPDGLTPFLDSLANTSWAFDNIWSAGIHTYNGIYSTLFAHPALMKKHPMEVVSVPQIDGLPMMLRNQGYQTLFFTTHDDMFDNMRGFLSANGIDKVIGQKDYPAKEVRSAMGVPDEAMFRLAMPTLNKTAANPAPFFAAFMTGSDHDPIVIPTETGFKPRHNEDKYKMSVEYADWSLQRFMQYAARASWFNNTVFVFVADHGCYLGHNSYDLAFSYQHIPLVVYAPDYTIAKAYNQLGLQTDVAATIMGLVGRPYINNTFSTDLVHERKPYAIFSADDRLACMNDSLLYIYRDGPEAKPSLYRYRDDDITDYYATDSATALPMRHAAFAWLQTSQWMIEHKKVHAISRF